MHRVLCKCEAMFVPVSFCLTAPGKCDHCLPDKKSEDEVTPATSQEYVICLKNKKNPLLRFYLGCFFENAGI